MFPEINFTLQRKDSYSKMQYKNIKIIMERIKKLCVLNKLTLLSRRNLLLQKAKSNRKRLVNLFTFVRGEGEKTKFLH